MKFILDDLEQPKAERIFVDRIETRKAFWDAFSTAQKGLEEPFVLHYYGVGGIGKTSLHSQLVKELQECCPKSDGNLQTHRTLPPYRYPGEETAQRTARLRR